MHLPPQKRVDELQVHCPLEQRVPDGQIVPQLPQFDESVEVLTHRPLHNLVPLGQEQEPLTQEVPLAHTLLQLPQ